MSKNTSKGKFVVLMTTKSRHKMCILLRFTRSKENVEKISELQSFPELITHFEIYCKQNQVCAYSWRILNQTWNFSFVTVRIEPFENDETNAQESSREVEKISIVVGIKSSLSKYISSFIA